MTKPRRNALPVFLQVLLFSILSVCYHSNFLIFPIFRATPFYLLPLWVAFAMYENETVAAIGGLLLGFFADAFSSFGGLFHTLFFFASGLLIALLIRYYLNNNIRSAILLVLGFSLAYYLLRWFCCPITDGSMTDATLYLMQYVFPDTLYTAVFIFPFYYLERFLHRLKSK